MKEWDLLHETRVILSLIYRDYLSTEEQRQRLLRQDDEELKEQEIILQEKYAIDFNNIKERRKQKTINIQQEEKNAEKKELAIVESQKWYQKIIYKILSIFKMR